MSIIPTVAGSDKSLNLFFNPGKVALVGATADPNRFGGRVLQRMREFGFRGQIFPVNPKLDVIDDLKCYASVADLPETPDHVGVVVPAGHVLGVLQDCAGRGVPFATVYTGGFTESGAVDGIERQAEISSLARETGMRIMGPNCNGLVNFVDAFAMTSSATIAGSRRTPGNVGIVSQSGGAGQVNIMWRALEHGLGISYQVSCGNSADLNVVDFIEFMVTDDATDVILVLAENIPDGRRFIDAAHLAASRGKPVVMLKLGRTSAGSQAAVSHTGIMAGSDAVCDSVMRQAGVIRVDDCSELYEMAMLLRARKFPRGRRVASTTISGGNGVLLVDLGAQAGLEWPEYTQQTKDRLAGVLPKLASTGNPTDVTNAAVGSDDIFSRCVQVIASDDNVDIVVPIFTMSRASDIRQTLAAAENIEKPLAVLWMGGCNDDPAYTSASVAGAGVPVYRNTLSCVRAIRAAADYGKFLAGLRPRGHLPMRPDGIDQALARRLLLSAGGRVLAERESKSVLAAYGFPVIKEYLAGSAAEAVGAYRRIGNPVAVKIESPDIPHKTEAGGVRLGLDDDAGVMQAYSDVMASVQAYKPGARIAGVLVQPMSQPGIEIILGVVQDAVFGAVVMTGMGGMQVDIYRDVSYGAGPIDMAGARRMLQELKGYKCLTGFRGQAPRDIDAVCDMMVRLSWFAHDFRDLISELDINPLVVHECGHGISVVDALIVRRDN